MSPGGRAWLVWGLGAAFYAYGFFQRVAPAVMVDDLMRDFALGAVLLGSLSAAYFYAYAAVQIPVGILLDRFGPRPLLLGATLLAAAGSVLFALAVGSGFRSSATSPSCAALARPDGTAQGEHATIIASVSSDPSAVTSVARVGSYT
jgi:MFS family permease